MFIPDHTAVTDSQHTVCFIDPTLHCVCTKVLVCESCSGSAHAFKTLHTAHFVRALIHSPSCYYRDAAVGNAESTSWHADMQGDLG